MKRILTIIVSVFFIFAQSLFAQSAENLAFFDNTSDFDALNITISYKNKTIFFPSDEVNNPILVDVNIENKGAETIYFKIADDRSFSLDIHAIDVKNEVLPQPDTLIRTRTTSSTVYFKEIAIEPTENFGFTIDLKDFIAIEKSSIYYATVVFYPELYKSRGTSISSNRIVLEINPPRAIGSQVVAPMDYTTGHVIQPEFLPPDQVVEQTIIARQRSLWDQFFLYMDIESIYFKNPQNKIRYNSLSENERQKLLQNFKNSLLSDKIDNEIIALPERFDIEKTTYTKNEGTVSVMQWFEYPTFTEIKRYTYYLRLRNNIWQIYDYTVDNIGTE